jgi:two-component SAPR family response regulator
MSVLCNAKNKMQVLIMDRSIQMIKWLEEILSEAVTSTTIDSSVSYKDAITLFTKYTADIVLPDIS